MNFQAGWEKENLLFLRLCYQIIIRINVYHVEIELESIYESILTWLRKKYKKQYTMQFLYNVCFFFARLSRSTKQNDMYIYYILIAISIGSLRRFKIF